MGDPTAARSSNPRLYFAYGSNLSLSQMASRCPTSSYHSFGRLRGYRWIIGERGYANVVKTEVQTDVVYGMLYRLEPEDEAMLDLAEGVPFAYLKRVLNVDIVERDGGGEREAVEALVYVDEERLGVGVCREEYVGRMNRGIRDAVGKGMEKSYVEKVLRRFVREEEVDEGRVVDPFDPGRLGKLGDGVVVYEQTQED